jgi:predicted TIM-barrel fold metal-dependent hydrolase
MDTKRRVPSIDIVVNLFTPEAVTNGWTGVDEQFKEQVRMPVEMRAGISIEDYLRKMDRAGIEHALLIAVRAGDQRVYGSFAIPYEEIAKWCDRYPDRFSGLAGVDPYRGVQQLKDLDHAVKELGFVGAHLYPHWFKLAPDHALYYPLYARCCELDIPIMMQVGQNLIYQKEVRLPSVARPILLDQVAIDFPDLNLIGIHIGVPWTDEMIAMAWKHERVFIGLDAYAPKHISASLLQYMNTYGQDKVMFGTDWPVIDPERAVNEMEAHDLREVPYGKIMRDTAIKLFKLESRLKTTTPAAGPAVEA